ncbi:Uncharacterized protein TCM_032637 [Theobroma cacao]|uniref:Uncharacterized protein n=1 Tax=Theobroma cacao TaxID=3641 RepID=A0A061FHF4_THECC|nr:Uncharacterized protein TCM_032637 [Theobroma cacao]
MCLKLKCTFHDMFDMALPMGWFLTTFYMLNSVSLKARGSHIVSRCHLTWTSKASRCSPIIGFKWIRFNLNKSVSLAYAEVINSQERNYFTPIY